MFTTIGAKLALFFTGKLPWKIYAGVAALALLGGTVWYCSEQVENRVEEAEKSGQLEERNTNLENTIKNVEKANEARDKINDSGPVGDRARYDQCVQSARTPENCKRLLPDVQTTND